MMKTIVLMSKLFVVMSLFGMFSCGGGGSSLVSTGTTTVQVNLLGAKQSGSANTLLLNGSSAIPATVRFIRITISAPDIATVDREIDVAGRTEVVETFELPNGKDRHFFARAVDGKGGSLYQGDILADLNGTAVRFDILMGFDMSGDWNMYMTRQGGAETGPDAASISQSGNSITLLPRIKSSNFVSADGTIVGSVIKFTVKEQECGGIKTTEFSGTASSDGTSTSGSKVATGGCVTGTESGTWRMVRGGILPVPIPLPTGFPSDVPAANYTISTLICISGICTSGSSFTVINSDINQFAQLLISALTTATTQSLNSNCGQAGGCSCITPVITYTPWNGSSFTITDRFDITCGTETSAVSIQFTATKL